MKKNPFFHRLSPLRKLELVAAGVIFPFFVLLLFLGSAFILKISQGASFLDGIFLISIVGIILAITIWFVASMLGNMLASFFLGASPLESAVSVNAVLQNFGFSDADSLLNLVRLHNISVYRAAGHFPGIYYREPLFATFAYAPFMRSHYFSKSLLYFDELQIDAVYSSTIKNIAMAKQELVHNQINADTEKQINTLQVMLDSAKAKLAERSLSEGPYKKTARARLLIIAQLAASSGLRDKLKSEWGKDKKPYSKDYINNQYEAYIKDHGDLKMLLCWLKGETATVFDDNVKQIFRASMPQGMIDWGGKEKVLSIRDTVEGIMTEDEKREISISVKRK